MFPPQKCCTEVFYSKPAEWPSVYSNVDMMGMGVAALVFKDALINIVLLTVG